MRLVAVAAGLVSLGIVALWVMGYTVRFEKGALEVVGPGRVSEYSAEAEANSPECQGLRQRFPEKPQYSEQEFNERSKAAAACLDAQTRYIKNRQR